MHEHILKALAWRYATKQFDATKLLQEKDLSVILESARLAPSSFGLQPWKFVLVENKEKRNAIRAAAWDQAQVTDASHLLVVMAKDDMDESYIDDYIQAIAQTRGITPEMLNGFREMMVGAVLSRSLENKKAWMAQQAYIPVGMILETAALLGVDATPMEGFDPAKVKDILNVPGYIPYVLIALGYRALSDKNSAYKKVRMNADDVVVRM